uniref:Uncharacterized protein n=1 Tax=Seriola dumerili TaxID=41447 RepID=A0A3B4UXU5_SERDU
CADCMQQSPAVPVVIMAPPPAAQTQGKSSSISHKQDVCCCVATNLQAQPRLICTCMCVREVSRSSQFHKLTLWQWFSLSSNMHTCTKRRHL